MILQATDESLFSFFWKGNERLVFTADYQGNESFFVGSTNLKGKRVIRIVETQRYERLTGGGGAGGERAGWRYTVRTYSGDQAPHWQDGALVGVGL